MIYFLLVDRFANGDPANDLGVDPTDPQAFHGGDLAGLTRHVDELAALGVDTLWLGPIAKMRDTPFYGHGAFHGYWTEDLARLEPRFGTDADLGRMVDALHHRKIGLVLDMVYNHVAPDHPWVTQRPDWFHHLGPIVNWNDPVEAQTHDVKGLPDLDQANPDVYGWLRDASVGWLRKAQPAAFRLDAVRHLDPAFVARIGKDVRAHAPGSFRLWGEVFDGNVKTVIDARAAAHLDSVFDYPLHYALREVVCDDAPAAAIPAVLDRGASVPGEGWITFLDNHDTSRITTACHGDAARVDLALRLLFALRGRPMITWGTEWGLQGADEPENRADMPWVAPAAAEAAWRTRTSLLRELALTRKTTPALRAGESHTIGLGATWFVVERRAGEQVRWVAYNGSDTPVAFGAATIPPRSVQVLDPAGAARPTVRGGKVTITVAHPPPDLPAGTTLRLVGSTAELGDWDPTRAPVVPGKVTFGADAEQYKLAAVTPEGAVLWSGGANSWTLGAPASGAVEWR